MPHAESAEPEVAVAAGSESKEGHDAAGGVRLYYRTRPAYAITDRVFHFGHIVPGLYPRGVTERVRLTNPTKIPVALTLSARADDGSSVFSVSPPTLDIPAHESRFVELTFCPTGMRRHTGIFLGEVEGGILAETRKVEFGLLGEGAMPVVSLVQVRWYGALILERAQL